MRNLNLHSVTRVYRAWAPIYDWATPLYLLGNEAPLRQRTIARLGLRPGQTVLDLACGTGKNFPLIQSLIGPTGRLVGVDYTEAMLDRARERVARQGWKNVELLPGDAAEIQLEEKFDAVLCTLAIGVIPDYRGALHNMGSHLKPGGTLALGDAKRSSHPFGRAFNWLADLLGYGAAEDVTRRPWEHLEQRVDAFHYEEWCMGFFYVASGRKPRPSGHGTNRSTASR